MNPTTVSPQSGNETCFNLLINTADKFHIKELDWKAKTMYLLFQAVSVKRRLRTADCRRYPVVSPTGRFAHGLFAYE